MKSAILMTVAAAGLLAGCSPADPSPGAGPAAATRTAVPSATAPAAGAVGPPQGAASLEASAAGETRTDEQGAVVFRVTPLDLNGPGDTLDFEIVMNTHSVDVSWDLAQQAILRTDTGLEIPATSWPIGGGHHYGGTLSFPAIDDAGEPILEGVGFLTLVIRDTDVPERIFEWRLGS